MVVAYLTINQALKQPRSASPQAIGEPSTNDFTKVGKLLLDVKEEETNNKTYQLDNNLTLLQIPAGDFMMGSDSGANDEKPVHKVTFDKMFWMGKTEITFDQYDAYAKAVGKSLPNDQKWGRETLPVINVSWNETQGYVQWLIKNNGYGLECRLPS